LKILAIRLSAIGDVVNTLPAIHAIRKNYPNCWISFLVEDKAKDLVKNHPDIDEAIIYDRKKWFSSPIKCINGISEYLDMLRTIRLKKFDIVLDFQGNIKSSIPLVLSCAHKRAGFARGFNYEYTDIFTNIHITPKDLRQLRVDKFMSLLSSIGIINSLPEYAFPDCSKNDEITETFLKDNAITVKRYLVLHPGTSKFGEEKKWSLENYKILALKVVSDLNIKIIVTWGPDEYKLAKQVCSVNPANVIMSFNTKSLLDLVSILKKSIAFVGADTGPMHLASASGISCVALFGPKDPAIYGPHGKGHRIISKNKNGSGDVNQITADDVFINIKEIINKTI